MNGSELLKLTGKNMTDGPNVLLLDFDPDKAVKFYIAMLSISLILGVLYCGFVIFKSWTNKTTLISYIVGLVSALLCRTFFSLLVAAIVYLRKSSNVEGQNTLLSLECISLNLVLAYWCILSIYVHGRVRGKEMDMTAYNYGLPGKFLAPVWSTVALFFAFVWIFVMASENKLVWLKVTYIPQWIVQSIRLLFLLVQLALVIDMARLLIIKKNSLDNDLKSLLIKIFPVMLSLLLVFWLQFGFSTGVHLLLNTEAYFYFWCFIDGIQLALLCPLLYLFEIWGGIYLYGDNFILTTITKSDSFRANHVKEVLCPEGARTPISTIQATYESMEKQKSDVVFSSVISPENFQKTMNLYNRFNVLPEVRPTYFQNEEFYDCIVHEKSQCNSQRNSFVSETGSFYSIQSTTPTKDTNKIQFDGVQKKNAFYKSKYLIVDDKQKRLSKDLSTVGGTLINFEEQSLVKSKPPATKRKLSEKFLPVESQDPTDTVKAGESDHQEEVKTPIQDSAAPAPALAATHLTNKVVKYDEPFANIIVERQAKSVGSKGYKPETISILATSTTDDIMSVDRQEYESNLEVPMNKMAEYDEPFANTIVERQAKSVGSKGYKPETIFIPATSTTDDIMSVDRQEYESNLEVPMNKMAEYDEPFANTIVERQAKSVGSKGYKPETISIPATSTTDDIMSADRQDDEGNEEEIPVKISESATAETLGKTDIISGPQHEEKHATIETISPEIYDELVNEVTVEMNASYRYSDKKKHPYGRNGKEFPNLAKLNSRKRWSSSSESEFEIQNHYELKQPRSYFLPKGKKRSRWLRRKPDDFNRTISLTENLNVATSKTSSDSGSEFEIESFKTPKIPKRQTQSDSELQ